jgi:hypothetical protein
MAAIPQFLQGFRLVTGDALNAIINAVNNLTGDGTAGAAAATSLAMTSITVYSGTAATRAAARAAAPATAPIGSLFFAVAAVGTTKPNAYIKTANAGADTDWERIVTAATD